MDSDEVAGEAYKMLVDPPRRTASRRFGALIAQLASAAFGDASKVTSAGEVVIKRRPDGREVLRVPGGPSEELAMTRQSIAGQLEHLTVEAFASKWNFSL